MRNNQNEEKESVSQKGQTQVLDRTQSFLDSALEADALDEKNYAIRSAMQHLSLSKDQEQTEQTDSE